MLNHIHHINFLVRDLEQAVQRYQTLGLDKPIIEDLAGRSVKTARFKIGESWLVLVQPTDNDSAPAKHLAKHGEGFFLLSLGTMDLDASLAEIAKRGTSIQPETTRRGLDNWRVSDLNSSEFFGAQIQLAEDL